MAKDIGRDKRAPKYLLPKDLKAAHREALKLKKKLDDKIEKEEKLKKAIAYEAKYKKEKAKFFDLVFQEGEIRISVLKSVAEFIEEANRFKHCVYSSEYFKKKDYLILSASVQGEKVETIEGSLNNLAVIQSRGLHNENTKYHHKIVTLVKNSFHHVKS